MTVFDRDTVAEALGGGRHRVRLHRRWWILRGPNGGYIASAILAAIRAEVPAERALRSLTVHYLAAPVEGDAEVVVRVERSGRSMSSVSARLEQDGRPLALALAALATPYPGAASYADAPFPAVPAPEDVPVGEGQNPPPFSQNFELRPTFGPAPFSAGDEARTGGWIRFREARPLDELALVTLADAWWPAAFGVVDRPIGAPTVDLTVHLRAPLPREHDHVLVDVRSGTAQDGFFEEDVNLWTRDGTLLAHARQLALVL